MVRPINVECDLVSSSENVGWRSFSCFCCRGIFWMSFPCSSLKKVWFNTRMSSQWDIRILEDLKSSTCSVPRSLGRGFGTVCHVEFKKVFNLLKESSQSQSCFLMHNYLHGAESLKANSHSASQIPHLLWNLKGHYHIWNSLSLVSFMSQMNQVHIFPLFP
jgi:hypothetical protein